MLGHRLTTPSSPMRGTSRRSAALFENPRSVSRSNPPLETPRSGADVPRLGDPRPPRTGTQWGLGPAARVCDSHRFPDWPDRLRTLPTCRAGSLLASQGSRRNVIVSGPGPSPNPARRRVVVPRTSPDAGRRCGDSQQGSSTIRGITQRIDPSRKSCSRAPSIACRSAFEAWHQLHSVPPSSTIRSSASLGAGRPLPPAPRRRGQAPKNKTTVSATSATIRAIGRVPREQHARDRQARSPRRGLVRGFRRGLRAGGGRGRRPNPARGASPPTQLPGWMASPRITHRTPPRAPGAAL